MAATTDSVLVLFPGALGDFMCFLPALWALRQRHAAPMRIIANAELIDLVRLPGATIASIDRREIADLFGPSERLSPETHELCGGFATIHSWSGFSSPDLRRHLALLGSEHVWVHPFRGMRPGQHATDYYARCVGLVPVRPPASTVVHDSKWWADFRQRHRLADRHTLVMHVGSGSAKKNWQGFGEVARYWRQHYPDAIVLLHGPAENAGSTPVTPDVLPVAGLSLPQVAALLQRSSLYLGNDSGISHLAAAVGAHGVALFGPSDPTVWAPRGGALQILHAPEPCQHCGPNALCVHRLPPDRVIRFLEALKVQPQYRTS
jgi:ADP-heptose:LPS heptosyltransferase